MSTTVVPAPVLNTDEMILSQIDELEKFFGEHQRSGTYKVLRPRWPLKDYVRRVLDAHIDLVEQFNGWRWHSRPFEKMPLSAADVSRIITGENQRWSQGAVLYENDRKRAPEPQPPIPLSPMTSEADLIYCSMNACHFPQPKATAYTLWRSNLYIAEGGAKEATEEFAARLMVKIRTGQAPTRAVLAEVRKTFKEHPQYVRMWESICEKLGVGWLSSKGFPITFSFAPVDFLRMGHWGEKSSCYATGGGSEHSKHNLSVLTNSIMALFYKEETPNADPMKLRPKQSPSGRCWGLLDLDNQGAAFSNIYLLNFQEVRPSLEAALEQAFGWKVEGGLDKGDSFRNFMEYAYTNGDTNMYATKERLLAVQSGIGRQLKLPEAERHKKVFCNGCQTPFGHESMLSKCKCGQHSCDECSKVTDCCKQKYCRNCKPRISTCAGCGKIACDRCVSTDGKLGTCVDTKKQYCGACAKTLATCVRCHNTTSTPSVCSVDAADISCQTCAKEKHRQCDRCKKPAGLKYITRCGGCKERRCDNCQKAGESPEPKSLCETCQANGVPAPKAFEPDPKVLEQFTQSLQALPPDMREQYLTHMQEFKWDLDAVLLNEDEAVDPDEEQDDDL